ncbi:MAG: YqaJ viral recombinase family protein [Cellvibrionales bacterium]|nr:YqaJ viral recombinase family protein [Cellvibrionales bacterium]
MMQTQQVKRHRHGALQLVSTQAMPRETWLDVRKQGIGASDAAAAVGISPYQSPLELWLIKTGRDSGMPKPNPDDESSPMYWGNILEPIVAQHYTKRTGNKVRKVNAVLQHPDADKHWMLANLDYPVTHNSDVQILECKTAGEWGAKHWRDGVPEYVQCQVQHQLAVTGKQAADVCVLLCGQEIKIYRIERDEALIEKLIALERQFWHCVETDTPPPVDGSDSSGRALKYLYPNDSGDVLDLTEDSHLCQVFTDLLAARDTIAQAQQQEDLYKQTLQEKMGEASRIIFPAGEVSWKKNKTGSRRFLVRA